MILNNFPYILIPDFSNSIDENVKHLFIENGKDKIYEHVCKVAEKNVEIALAYGLDVGKCHLAGMLHDISGVINPDDMLLYTRTHKLCYAKPRKSSLSCFISEFPQPSQRSISI